MAKVPKYNLDMRPSGIVRITTGNDNAGYDATYDSPNITVIPASGYYAPNAWQQHIPFVFPQGLSSSSGEVDKIPQQTFLGASIRSFSMNGGFGDTSSTLSVDLIVDEYNHSDRLPQGEGDDVYHSGNGDGFVPPMVGSPVYFKFGKTLATVEQAYRLTFDELYKVNTTFTPPYVGSGHVVFGGILQSYVQNRGPGGNPLYTVQVTDPREILSNVTLILNNYAGTSYNTKNLFNIYGFLEHNMSTALSGQLQSAFGSPNFLTLNTDSNGLIYYSGSNSLQYPLDCFVNTSPLFFQSYKAFPVTGTGFSRRGPNGIPYYRVAQAVNSLLSTQYDLPVEYQKRGFGKVINFRGYNYVVDFSGLPTLPPLYFLDFDQINLLDLALEICDVASSDLFVSLLPVIPNHVVCSHLNNFNTQQPPSGMIHGIIRLDSIDRSHAPRYGSIKKYIESLSGVGIYVENEDIGFELSNVVTDKFVVGAQEIETHFFSSNSDRDTVDARARDSSNNGKQWILEDQLKQQIIPYYGLLGNKAVSIPKGWGSYQQILLDAAGLNAKGVGAYYVATEMELRCAAVSYDCWKNFLKQYNDIYLESLEDTSAFKGAALSQTANIANIPPNPISTTYGVTVPRSVFHSYAITPFSGNFLSSPCNPPYGYPLYYKRMSSIGIPEGGLTKMAARITSCIDGAASLMGADASNYKQLLNNQLQELSYIREEYGTLTAAENIYYNAISGCLNKDQPDIKLLSEASFSLHQINAVMPRLAKKGIENALKIYSFLKKIADENLGKKFLVKIPNKVNLRYTPDVSLDSRGSYTSGPFGFRPRQMNDLDPSSQSLFMASHQGMYHPNTSASDLLMKQFLGSGASHTGYVGALKSNYNPISNQYECNYFPSNLGGFCNFDLLANIYRTYPAIMPILPSGVSRALVPTDLTNFLSDDGRISPYVRFDHSEHLSFKDFNSEDFTQQIDNGNTHRIPDLCEFLDNTGDDEWHDFTNSNANRPDFDSNLQKTIAFVKCSVDEKLYMTPKIFMSGLQVYGNCGATDYKMKTSRPRKIFIPCSGLSGTTLIPGTGVYVDSFRYMEYEFYPPPAAGSTVNRYIYKMKPITLLNTYVVDTDILDTDHVYALITLPNKVTATKDTRYRDGLNQKLNTYDIKHYLTVDVVKNLPEFATPGYASKPKEVNIKGYNGPDCKFFTAEVASKAWMASRQALAAMRFGLHNQMQLIAPSPVYPDLVALPLISSERSYGPWISSQLDGSVIGGEAKSYINIGGKIEFIKDENLSPWNYGGYDLMHEAGKLQAEFSNSLLLFSERGGFTFPSIPRNSLCTALMSGGPLVTNISMDVSDAGFRTTYKMDTYTASFGKIHKQKQDMISKISRERQRLRDERNAMIRRGISKLQSNNFIIPDTQTINNAFESKNHIVASVFPVHSFSYAPIGGDANGRLNDIDHYYAASMQSESDIVNVYNNFDNDVDRYNMEYNTASASMDDMYMPISHEPHHQNMPNIQYADFGATYRLYESEDFLINDDDITYPA